MIACDEMPRSMDEVNRRYREVMVGRRPQICGGPWDGLELPARKWHCGDAFCVRYGDGLTHVWYVTGRPEGWWPLSNERYTVVVWRGVAQYAGVGEEVVS